MAKNRLTVDDLGVFITSREREYLIKLLGAELYGIFYADLSSATIQIPQTARFTAIFNQFAQDDPTIVSEGIRKMLTGIIYYHYVRDHNLYHTITGMVQSNNENSVAGIDVKASQYITRKYAKALETYKAIQDYIKLHLDVYPEFRGVAQEQSAFFF